MLDPVAHDRQTALTQREKCAARARRPSLGLRPRFVRLAPAHSHPDCRCCLTLIGARQCGRAAISNRWFSANFRPLLTPALQMRRAALQADDALLSSKDRRALHHERIVAFFNDRRRHGRGVPIWTTAHNGVVRRDAHTGTITRPVNMHLLHLHVGIDALVKPKAHLRTRSPARPI